MGAAGEEAGGACQGRQQLKTGLDNDSAGMVHSRNGVHP